MAALLLLLQRPPSTFPSPSLQQGASLMNRLIRAAVAAAVFFLASHNMAAQPCAVTLTDVTDYTTWQSDTSLNGLNHYYTFRATATGTDARVLLVPVLPLGIRGDFVLSCETAVSCRLEANCVTPGSYQIVAEANCADVDVSQTLPLIVSSERPDHWITGVIPLGGTQYRVDAVFRVPVGQNAGTPEWRVYKRLPDGTFSTDYGRFFNPTVTAAPGDRVDVLFSTCSEGTDLPGTPPYGKIVTTYIPAPPAPCPSKWPYWTETDRGLWSVSLPRNRCA
jgi:hypothetical protein